MYDLLMRGPRLFPTCAGFDGETGIFIVSVAEMYCFRISGVGISSGSVIAITIAVALEKRFAGSFARLRMMTADTAGEIVGLISEGAGGTLLTCCIITCCAFSPPKGRIPVHIS